MKLSTIKVFKGSLHTRSMLDKYADDQLQSILKNLDHFLYSHSDPLEWWFSMKDDIPTGLIVTTYTERSSRLVYYWFDNSLLEMHQSSVRALLKNWMATDYKSFIADIRPLSRLNSLMDELSFNFDKKIFAIYSVDTQYSDFEGPENYILRKPKVEEVGDIYDFFIDPSVEKGSPTYIPREQFIRLGSSDPMHREQWLICTDENDRYLGFAGSPPIQLTTIPVLYGPYTEYDVVDKLMISEFLSFWKMKKMDTMRILKSEEISDDTLSLFGIEEISEQAVNRYVFKK